LSWRRSGYSAPSMATLQRACHGVARDTARLPWRRVSAPSTASLGKQRAFHGDASARLSWRRSGDSAPSTATLQRACHGVARETARLPWRRFSAPVMASLRAQRACYGAAQRGCHGDVPARLPWRRLRNSAPSMATLQRAFYGVAWSIASIPWRRFNASSMASNRASGGSAAKTRQRSHIEESSVVSFPRSCGGGGLVCLGFRGGENSTGEVGGLVENGWVLRLESSRVQGEAAMRGARGPRVAGAPRVGSPRLLHVAIIPPFRSYPVLRVWFPSVACFLRCRLPSP